jgi:hypothetical protein
LVLYHPSERPKRNTEESQMRATYALATTDNFSNQILKKQTK